MTTLRWGLLSTARINQSLITPLHVSPRNRLAAVASRDGAKAEAYARQWNIPRALGSYEALIVDPDIDVIYNSLPNHLHAEWTIKAAQAGKHVLCEKPLALTLDQIDAMEAAANANRVVVMEAFMYRHHPQTLKVKELTSGGAIGQVQFVRGSFSFPLTDAGDVRLVKEWGGGSIWDIGCYPISYARLIVGAEPVEVFGQHVLGRGGVDELFVGQLRFPNDVYAQFDSSFRLPLRAHMEIVGVEAALTVPAPFKPGLNEQILVTSEVDVKTITIPGQELYLGEVENMADAILNGEPTRISFADSRGNLKTILALLQSAREGRPVRIT